MTGTVLAPAPAAPADPGAAELVRGVRRDRTRRTRRAVALLALALLAALAVRVLLGRYTVTVPDFFAILAGEQIPGASFIVLQEKLPRAVLGALGLADLLALPLDRLAEVAGAADDRDGCHSLYSPQIPNLRAAADCR